jgi:hypothetical protein
MLEPATRRIVYGFLLSAATRLSQAAQKIRVLETEWNSHSHL